VLVIGSGNDPSALRTPTLSHWQWAHDSLGMTLYALLLESICWPLQAMPFKLYIMMGFDFVLPSFTKSSACIIPVLPIV
jgi:hypothetical protein